MDIFALISCRCVFGKYILGCKRRGSYTVEISMLMPIIIATILFVIYLCIYSHDLVVIEYGVDRVLDCDEIPCRESDIENRIREYISERVIGKWDYEMQICIGDDEVSINLVAKMGNTQGLLRNILGNKYFKYVVNGKKRLLHETRQIKNYDL